MKYETPEMTTLMPAINAVQAAPSHVKGMPSTYDGNGIENELSGTYTDWE